MSENTIKVDKDNFKAEVLEAEIPVLVDFWAAWCAPCKAIAPVLEELAADYKGQIKVAKVDIDQNQELAQEYNVTSIPNLIFFADAKKVDQQIGFSSKADLENKIKAII